MYDYISTDITTKGAGSTVPLSYSDWITNNSCRSSTLVYRVSSSVKVYLLLAAIDEFDLGSIQPGILNIIRRLFQWTKRPNKSLSVTQQ
ncbi:Hypothetical protein PP7435_CHR1-2093 [Komagataella phaffii CBS 7435]|uniref:Uncharacterized protein n=1 Tax=Komagataella phaffii (strain ATCC 76273 / CBS 7435 / CECT 11047 / NRRL Y-11430 / Wegner 21-1) TaxID=981350 RepID=A0A1G4KP65_KOMPC|nr:Hypothetical protein BQ9382_C1-2358 [Komagataella phaffii CBS 7435]SCV11806.1 Hypothetical protein PP7435_CHR1-2093 [Komagataella phaffii CBS 7435]